MKREFLQNLKVGEEALPKEVIDAIKEERDNLKAQQNDGMDKHCAAAGSCLVHSY